MSLPQVKKLPRSVTIASLRLLLEKLFKVKGRAQSLFLRAPGDPLPEALAVDDDERPLSFFGVQVSARLSAILHSGRNRDRSMGASWQSVPVFPGSGSLNFLRT